MAGACECGNELSVSIECCEYFDQLWNYQLSTKDYVPWDWLVMLNIHCSVCVGSVCRSLGHKERIVIILVAFYLSVYLL